MIRRNFIIPLGYLALIFAGPAALAQTLPEPTSRLVLKGHDPVAYFTEGRPRLGKPEYETVFDEERYRFASVKNMSLFRADPDKYAPQFAGACTNGLAKGVKLEADPALWRIVDGRLFVFTGRSVPDEMDAHPDRLIAKARENWQVLAHEPFGERIKKPFF